VVLVIGPDTSPEEAFRTVEHFRLSPFHASLPIALIQRERDLTLATQAMSAGVTEIFLQPENKQLSDFIAECAAASEPPSFSGKALVVEDDEIFAEYLSDLCQTLGFATTLVDSFEKAIEALLQHRFQIVITDVVLKGTQTGLTLLRHIHQEHGTNFPVIVTSGYDDLPRRLMALKNGVGDFISKPFAGEEFIWRVQRVMQLVALNEQGNAQPLTESFLGVRNDLMQILSPREYEIFNSMLKGLGDKEIAASLGISYWTVRTHVQQIFSKTGAINRRELMARYITPSGSTSQ
jgi:DNA-binding NarL/FixJ family response regulator